MGADITLVLKNDLAELDRLNRVVEAFGRRYGMGATPLFDLHLAVDEVFTNIVSYGYDDDAEHAITLRLFRGGDADAAWIEVVVEDDGRPFNPLDVAPADVQAAVADRPIGGLGIYLVRRVMDSLEYQRQEGKNRVVMRKALVA